MSVFNRLLVTASLPLVPKPIVGRVASRYVAGETLDDALAVVAPAQRRRARWRPSTCSARRSRSAARRSPRSRSTCGSSPRIEREKLDSNVSIKLTLLGLKIDEGFCRDNVERIAAAAKAHGNFVRIDMEDSS